VLAGGVLTGTYDQKAPPPGDTHMASSLAGTARDRYWNPATFAVADRVSALAKDLGKSAAQVATAWALSKPGITSVIVGSSRPEQVHANVDALSIELDESAIAQLEASDS
jgi:aryl-alcohol dehydrogenase-like predicted oxidoreductase